MTIITYAAGSRASTAYSATINGSPLPVWGASTDTHFTTPYWLAAQVIQQSFCTFASDETVIITVSVVGGSVSSAKVYTNGAASAIILSVVSGGVCSFSLPPDTCAWVEVNGVRGQPLLISSRPIVATPAGPTVDTWDGTQTRAAAGRTLVFPAGVHTIGQSFEIEPGGSVFLHGEAWVIGSLFCSGSAGDQRIFGFGFLSGEWGSAIRAFIRSLPFEQAVAYSMIRGAFSIAQNATVSGITIVDPPFYATHYGPNIYDRVTIIGPWWANANAFFPGSKAPELTASMTKCMAFVHDDVFDFGEYLESHTAEDCIVGSIGSSSFIISYWPSIDSQSTHFGKRTTLVCLNYAVGSAGSIITAWCDGGSIGGGGPEADERYHVVSDVDFDGIRFVGSEINGIPIDLRNKLYPAEWGLPQGQALGQIRKFWFRNVTFEVVPTFRSKIQGKDRINTPHDIWFENVWYAGVRLTVANFDTYFEVNEFPYNIFVDGIPYRGSPATTGSWYQQNPQLSPFSFQPLPARLDDGRTYDGPQVWFPSGATAPSRGPYRNVTAPASWSASDVMLGAAMAGSSTFVPATTVRVSLRAVAQGSSSASAGATVRQGLISFLQAGSSASSNLTKISPAGLAAALTSSSGFQATPSAGVSLASSMQGSSSVDADMTPPGTVEIGCVMQAGSTISCLVGIIASTTSLQQFDPMKQRVYNTLLALCNAGPFHEAKVDVKTGQMTVFTSKPTKPVSVDVREIAKQFQPASRYRRAFNVAEIASWVFEVEIRFASGVRASCEVFEQTIADAGITVPPAKGIAASRSLLARLTDSKYDEPPAQNPSLGSVVLFTFEVVPETLRS